MSIHSPPDRAQGRPIAMLLSAIVLVFGFLGMAAYSLTGPAFGPLPTVWQSWGGTAGDLLLPAVVYSLIRGNQLLDAPPSRIHVTSLVMGIVGGGGGASAQAAWLLDPQPNTNWMLVAPHTFSGIGWYHFVFLIVVSGFIAGTAFELLLRSRRGKAMASESIVWAQRLRLVLGSANTTASLTCCCLFVTAVAADSITSLESLASMGTTTVLVTPAVALTVAAAMLGSSASLLIRPVLTAAGLTAALAAAVGFLLLPAINGLALNAPPPAPRSAGGSTRTTAHKPIGAVFTLLPQPLGRRNFRRTLMVLGTATDLTKEDLMSIFDAAKTAAQAAATTASVAANIAAGQIPADAMYATQWENEQRIRMQQIEQASNIAGQPTISSM